MDDITGMTDSTDVDFTNYQCLLMARITVSSTGSQPTMIEWSVSPQGASPGQGMMQPIWRDIMHGEDGDVAIFTTESSHLAGR